MKKNYKSNKVNKLKCILFQHNMYIIHDVFLWRLNVNLKFHISLVFKNNPKKIERKLPNIKLGHAAHFLYYLSVKSIKIVY